MPFWWGRRGKFWYGRRRFPRRRKTYKRRYRKRPTYRRNRRFTRRRRKRRTKVKRKKKFLRLLQWQPDSIRKCKIKAIASLMMGYNGMQHRNYTTDQNDWTLPRTPGGGGFSTTVFSLQYLYELYQLKKCIWTYPNANYDLCRYTGCRFKFFRHPWWDFIVNYTLMYPMSLNFGDYMETQPLRMLLQQKKIVILSLKHKSSGKLYVTRKFKPPKQMINKWFFQDMFATKPLLLIKSAVCDLFQPDLGASGGNRLVTLKCIDIHTLYITGNWGLASSTGYSPVSTWSHPKTVTITKTNNTTETLQVGSIGHTVDYATGWFQKKILQSLKLTVNGSSGEKTATYTARYNPSLDTGDGNTIYLCSITADNYRQPTTDKVIIAHNQPLWMLLFGFLDYVIHIKKSKDTMRIYYLMIVSQFIEPQTYTYFPKTHLIIDQSFINGAGPFNTTVPDTWLQKWYPTLLYQQESIANIIKAGPFIPKPDPTQQNWELHYKATFYFKWGGSLQQQTNVDNPQGKGDYPAPDTVQSAVQVTDPTLQTPETMLHNWDFRRGYITKKALKRMSKHLETKSIVSTDSDSEPAQKKKKTNISMPLLQDQQTQETKCLLSLCEEDSCQEQETQTEASLRHLINQQHKQQQGIKLKLLQLLTHMKRSQQQLQLQTGILE
nr:MAG: ORF1 [Torque teno midi virus]